MARCAPHKNHFIYFFCCVGSLRVIKLGCPRAEADLDIWWKHKDLGQAHRAVGGKHWVTPCGTQMGSLWCKEGPRVGEEHRHASAQPAIRTDFFSLQFAYKPCCKDRLGPNVLTSDLKMFSPCTFPSQLTSWKVACRETSDNTGVQMIRQSCLSACPFALVLWGLAFFLFKFFCLFIPFGEISWSVLGTGPKEIEANYHNYYWRAKLEFVQPEVVWGEKGREKPSSGFAGAWEILCLQCFWALGQN